MDDDDRCLSPEYSDETPVPRPPESAPQPSPPHGGGVGRRPQQPRGSPDLGGGADMPSPIVEVGTPTSEPAMSSARAAAAPSSPPPSSFSPPETSERTPQKEHPQEQQSDADGRLLAGPVTLVQQLTTPGKDVPPEPTEYDSPALREFMELRRRLIMDENGQYNNERRGGRDGAGGAAGVHGSDGAAASSATAAGASAGANHPKKSRDPPGKNASRPSRSSRGGGGGRSRSRTRSVASQSSASALSNISEGGGSSVPSFGLTDVIEDGPQHSLDRDGKMSENMEEESRTSSVIRLEDRLDMELDRRERERKEREASKARQQHQHQQQQQQQKPQPRVIVKPPKAGTFQIERAVADTVPALVDLSYDDTTDNGSEWEPPQTQSQREKEPLPAHRSAAPAPPSQNQGRGGAVAADGTAFSESTDSSPLVYRGPIPPETDLSSMSSMSASDWNSVHHQQAYPPHREPVPAPASVPAPAPMTAPESTPRAMPTSASPSGLHSGNDVYPTSATKNFDAAAQGVDAKPERELQQWQRYQASPSRSTLPDRQVQIADFVDGVLDNSDDLDNSIIMNDADAQPAGRGANAAPPSPPRDLGPLCMGQPPFMGPQKEQEGRGAVTTPDDPERQQVRQQKTEQQQRLASARQRRRAEFDELTEYDERCWKERDEVTRIAEQEYVETLRRRLPQSEKSIRKEPEADEGDRQRDGRKKRSSASKGRRSKSAPPRNWRRKSVQLAPNSESFRSAISSSSKVTPEEKQPLMQESLKTTPTKKPGRSSPSQLTDVTTSTSPSSDSVVSSTSSAEIAECISDISPPPKSRSRREQRQQGGRARSKSQPSRRKNPSIDWGDESTFMSVHTEDRMFPSGENVVKFLSASSIQSSTDDEEGIATATTSSSNDFIAMLTKSSIPSDSDGNGTTDDEGTLSASATNSVLSPTDDEGTSTSPTKSSMSRTGRDSPSSTTSSVEIAECVSDISPPPQSLPTRQSSKQKNLRWARSSEPYYSRQAASSRSRKDRVSEVARSIARPSPVVAGRNDHYEDGRRNLNAMFDAAIDGTDGGGRSSATSTPSSVPTDETSSLSRSLSTPSPTETRDSDPMKGVSVPVDAAISKFVVTGDQMDGMNAKAAKHVEEQEYDEALTVFGEVLDSHTARYGQKHPFVASTYHNMGIVHAKDAKSRTNPGEVEQCNREALSCFQSAARIARDSLGTDHPNVAVSLVRIGFLLLGMQRYENALVTFNEALRIRTSSLGTNHALVSKIYNNIGVTHLYLGNFDQAKTAFGKALKIQRSVLSRVEIDSNAGRVGKEFLHRAKLEVSDTLCNIGSLCLNWIEEEQLPVHEEKALIRDAINKFSEASSIRWDVLGPDHPLSRKTKSLQVTASNTLKTWSANSSNKKYRDTLQYPDSDSISAQEKGCNPVDFFGLNAMCRYATGYTPSPETLRAIEEANCTFDEPRLDEANKDVEEPTFGEGNKDAVAPVSSSPTHAPMRETREQRQCAQDSQKKSKPRFSALAALSKRKKHKATPNTSPSPAKEEGCCESIAITKQNKNDHEETTLHSTIGDVSTNADHNTRAEERPTTPLEQSGGNNDLDGDGLTFPGRSSPKSQPRTASDIKKMLKNPEDHLKDIYAAAAAHVDQNEFAQAAEIFKELVEAHKRTHGAMHTLVGSALHNLGIVYLRAEKHQDALDAFNAAVIVRSQLAKAHNKDDPDVAVSMVKKGVCNLLMRNFEDALVSFNDALSIRRRTIGELHPSTARVYNNIGCVHVEFNRLREARDAFESALKVQRNALREDPENSSLMFGASTTLSNLGYIYKLKGSHDKSVVVLREALTLQESVLGKHHPTVLATLDSLAEANARNKDCNEAIRCYNTILVRFSSSEDGTITQGPLSPQQRRSSAIAVYKIGRVHMKQNDHEAALRKLKEALFYVRGLGDATLEAKFEAEILKVEKHLQSATDMDWV